MKKIIHIRGQNYSHYSHSFLNIIIVSKNHYCLFLSVCLAV